LIAADDALPGGEDLVDALAHRPDRGFLGWAAPGGGAVVDRDTVESGLDEARERLGRLVTELLACAPDRTDTAAAGRLVVLPARFREVADGVVELADHLLLPIAYREPLLLRGVHPVVPASRPAAGAAGFRFVRELFARRIFPEVRLAVPSRVAASRRHRQVRWAQIALAVGALLAVGGWSWLALDRSDVVSVRTLLSSLASELRAVQSAPNDQKLLEATAISLIGALSNLSAETVESTLAPTSHLTGATDRVVDAIRVGSRFALLRATARQLQEIKVDAALAHLEGAAAPPEGTAQLEAALNALTRLRGEIGAYRELHRAPDAGAVADVVGYAFAEELPANFSRHAQLYVDALRGAPLPTVSTERIAERVTPALEEAIRDLARAQLVERGPVQALARIAPLDTGGAGTLPMASFADAVLALRDLQDELARDPAWLASGSGPLPPELGRLVEGVAALCPRAGDALCLVEPTFPQRLADELGTFVDAQRERILTAALFGVRPAVVEGDEGWRLAPPLARAEAALEDYFRNLDLEPVPPPVRATLPVRPDAPLAWDPAGLDGLLNLSAELLVVDTEAFDRLPASVATTARALAERRLAQLLDAEIRRAAERGRGLGEGRDDAALAGAFRLAEAPLRVLHERFRQLSMPALADRLDRAARPQAQALLERADRLRAREGLYTLFDPTLSAWDGSEPLTFAAFNVYRPGELPGVLGRWRDGLAALSATYAEPSVGYLEAVATDAPPGPLQRRWTSIAQRLATYDRQLPENTLVQFERFVLERTAELTLDSCGELTPPPAGGDYFRDLQRDLATAIRRRCAELEGRELVVGYADLADAFNASLAGRYPFADPDGDPDGPN
ncbi:MAG: type VI secretion protein IcmF/TssM N-terminal domain-containing protein, partial [Alphaproteobacteria bacterium]